MKEWLPQCAKFEYFNQRSARNDTTGQNLQWKFQGNMFHIFDFLVSVEVSVFCSWSFNVFL